MIPRLRHQYNARFTKEKYGAYLSDLNNIYNCGLDFRMAETPVFVPRTFTQNMLDTCTAITEVVMQPGYRKKSERAIPPKSHVPNETDHPDFIVFDFAVCVNDAGEPEPRLIEMQAFPSIFAWQVLMYDAARRHFDLPDQYSSYLNGFHKQSYLELFRRIVVSGHQPENVVLLEIFPHRQKTRIDFYATRDFLGIQPVCITEIIREGRDIFYRNKGKKIRIERIYNRVIFDELLQQSPDVQEKGNIFREQLNVEWIPHPNWFYRISKFTLPFLNHPFIPQTSFLNEIDHLPSDLENYVLKPLFSFAGQGVVIDVTRAHIDSITDPGNWILQRKVAYAPIVKTPGEGAKAEIRLFYFWEPGASRPIATNNLVRLSKGKMIGVDYNKNKEWVGASFCLFEMNEQ